MGARETAPIAACRDCRCGTIACQACRLRYPYRGVDGGSKEAVNGLDLGLSIGAVVAPFAATLLAAAVGLRGIKKQVPQKDEADSRAEWWRRFERALEWTTNSDRRLEVVGYETVLVLLDSPLAGAEEGRLAITAAQELFDQRMS